MSSSSSAVFDTLTHFLTPYAGVSLNRPLGIDGYLAYSRTWQNPNVQAVNLMEGGCPEYRDGAAIVVPCRWTVEGTQIVEHSYVTENGRVSRSEVRSGFYEPVNRFVLASLKSFSHAHPGIRFFYSPMIHPRRTSVEELERMVGESREHMLGIKVQGTATASGPADIPEPLARFIAGTGIPMILHTDFHDGALPAVLETAEDARQYLHSINTPQAWVRFCQKYHIRASLQHGARNDPEVFAEVRRSAGQFTVGLGPKINGLGQRIVLKTSDYVRSVVEGVGPDLCMFSSDYPHNEDGEDLTAEVMSILSPAEQAKVFHETAEKFFGVTITTVG